jgi:hypothetical protein
LAPLRRLGWAAACAWLGTVLPVSAASPATVTVAPSVRASVMRTTGGAFEVIGWDLQAVQVITDLAAAVERSAGPAVGLRERFPTPVFVRLPDPEAVQWERAVSLVVEPGGLVTLWLRLGPDLGEPLAVRALVRAWATRLAILDRGYAEGLAPPAWLEVALAQATRASVEPLELPAMAMRAEISGPWPLGALLGAPPVELEPAGFVENAYLLMLFLRAESGASGRWERLVRGSLRGHDARWALASAWGVAVGEAEAELWWAVGFHHHRTRVAGPLRSPRASYRALQRASRVVLSVNGRDEALDWSRVWFWRDAPAVQAELAARAALLPADAALAHPYFREGYAALHRMYAAVLAGDRVAFNQAQRRWAEELAAGAAATRAAESAGYRAP